MAYNYILTCYLHTYILISTYVLTYTYIILHTYPHMNMSRYIYIYNYIYMSMKVVLVNLARSRTTKQTTCRTVAQVVFLAPCDLTNSLHQSLLIFLQWLVMSMVVKFNMCQKTYLPIILFFGEMPHDSP